MAQNFVVNGNIQYPPSPTGQAATTSISMTIPFTQRSDDILVFAAPVAAQPINFGTITNPKAIYIEVQAGSCQVKLAAGDATSIALGLPTTPLATDRSSLLLSNPSGLGTLPMVVTVAQSCTLKIVAVQ